MRKEEEKQKMNRSSLYIDFIVHFDEEVISVNISDRWRSCVSEYK